jgi:hypothetical protein
VKEKGRKNNSKGSRKYKVKCTQKGELEYRQKDA